MNIIPNSRTQQHTTIQTLRLRCTCTQCKREKKAKGKEEKSENKGKELVMEEWREESRNVGKERK